MATLSGSTNLISLTLNKRQNVYNEPMKNERAWIGILTFVAAFLGLLLLLLIGILN